MAGWTRLGAFFAYACTWHERDVCVFAPFNILDNCERLKRPHLIYVLEYTLPAHHWPRLAPFPLSPSPVAAGKRRGNASQNHSMGIGKMVLKYTPSNNKVLWIPFNEKMREKKAAKIRALFKYNCINNWTGAQFKKLNFGTSLLNYLRIRYHQISFFSPIS